MPRPASSHPAPPDSPRRTRLVATLGPACERPRMIAALVRAGVDVFRINASHSEPGERPALVRSIRSAARGARKPVGILFDLQGPKLRLGTFDPPVAIRPGDRVILVTRRRDADPARGVLPVAYRPLPEETRPGHELLLADGAVRLAVTRVERHRVHTRVLEGDELRARAGLSLPQATAVRSAITAKDRRDLADAVALGADFVALSFVRRAADLAEARRLLARHGSDAWLIAKIETAPAIERLEEIVAAADGVMVARGDLGLELPPERVPVEQKRIVRAACARGIPVITATQMLESMRHATRPTRAEASDVANAVFDGSWALMLSAETATGEHPVAAVRMMDRIARVAEEHADAARWHEPEREQAAIAEGVAEAAVWLAVDVGASAVVALTRSGATARQVARVFPPLPALAYSSSERAIRRTTLLRGITARPLALKRSFEVAVRAVLRDLRRRGDVRSGDRVVVIGGSPDEPEGATNQIVVREA